MIAPVPPADDDIETRLAIVERNVAQLREQLAITNSDAAAARMLAAGADHDVSEVRAELRAHTQALNALRETQLEQGRMIDEQGREMRAGFARQEGEMREGFAKLATGMAQITALLTNLGGSEAAAQMRPGSWSPRQPSLSPPWHLNQAAKSALTSTLVVGL